MNAGCERVYERVTPDMRRSFNSFKRERLNGCAEAFAEAFAPPTSDGYDHDRSYPSEIGRMVPRAPCCSALSSKAGERGRLLAPTVRS